MTEILPIKAPLMVPSGKIVISGASFHNEYLVDDVPDSKYDDCTMMAYLKERLELRANNGLLWGYIGDSAPSIFQSDDSVTIGTNPQMNDIEVPFFEGINHGQIITDEALYHIADHDDYVSRGGRTDQHWKHQRPTIVSLTPGRYVLTHHYGFTTNDRTDGHILHATLERSDEEISNQRYPEEGLYDRLPDLFPEAEHRSIDVVEPLVSYVLKLAIPTGKVLRPIHVPLQSSQMSDFDYVVEEANRALQVDIDESQKKNELFDELMNDASKREEFKKRAEHVLRELRNLDD